MFIFLSHSFTSVPSLCPLQCVIDKVKCKTIYHVMAVSITTPNMSGITCFSICLQKDFTWITIEVHSIITYVSIVHMDDEDNKLWRCRDSQNGEWKCLKSNPESKLKHLIGSVHNTKNIVLNKRRFNLQLWKGIDKLETCQSGTFSFTKDVIYIRWLRHMWCHRILT